MATRMQQRRGTAAQWTAANPILAAGEIGFETDTSKFKMGNGSSAWSALSYFANAAELTALIDGAPDLLNTLGELADAIGEDPAFFTSIANNLSTHSADTTNVHGIADTAALATKAYADLSVSNHEQDTTNVHGIVDMGALPTRTEVASSISDHSADTTNVHGIADTSVLVTSSALETSVSTAVSTHAADTTSVHGIPDTSVLATQTDVSDAVEAEAVVTAAALASHNSETENVHGISDMTALVTQTDLTNALDGATVDQQSLAGVGIDWNVENEQFDIDSTVATKTYADDAVSAHQSDTTSVHGIADTSLLATTANVATAKSEAITEAGTAADTKVSTAVAALTKSSVGLGNVDNTADASKPVSTEQATAIATAKSEAIADATARVDALLTGAPAALNTLDELAAALGDDANFASTVTTNLGLKAPLANPTFTGTVTVAAAGVAFTDGTQTKEGVQSRTPIIQKSASYTLSALSERDSMIEMGSASALTLTVPTNATVAWPVGTSIDILQTGAGQVTIAPAAGVTINGTPGLKLRTTWSGVTLFKRATDTWVVYGDLTA